MVKEPVAGRCKTRLARDLGLSRSIGFYRHTTAAVIARVARDPRWKTVLAVAPDPAVSSRAWPCHLRRMPQGRGGLGERMARLLVTAPRGPTILVGSDVPGITAPALAKAFRLLGSHDAVLGPAGDGGFWLIGLKRRPREVCRLGPVRWSTPFALQDTRANLLRQGLTIAVAATLHDVDDAQGLAAAGSDHGKRVRRGWCIGPFTIRRETQTICS